MVHVCFVFALPTLPRAANLVARQFATRFRSLANARLRMVKPMDQREEKFAEVDLLGSLVLFAFFEPLLLARRSRKPPVLQQCCPVVVKSGVEAAAHDGYVPQHAVQS
jgi:hypothetical protein